eukprot:349837-Chlamydomonas_euryale.AAC.2
MPTSSQENTRVLAAHVNVRGAGCGGRGAARRARGGGRPPRRLPRAGGSRRQPWYACARRGGDAEVATRSSNRAHGVSRHGDARQQRLCGSRQVGPRMHTRGRHSRYRPQPALQLECAAWMYEVASGGAGGCVAGVPRGCSNVRSQWRGAGGAGRVCTHAWHGLAAGFRGLRHLADNGKKWFWRVVWRWQPYCAWCGEATLGRCCGAVVERLACQVDTPAVASPAGL